MSLHPPKARLMIHAATSPNDLPGMTPFKMKLPAASRRSILRSRLLRTPSAIAFGGGRGLARYSRYGDDALQGIQAKANK